MLKAFFNLWWVYWEVTPLWLPEWLRSKEISCNAGDTGDVGYIPESGRSPGRGNGNPLQYSCQENSMDRGACQTTVCGIAKSQTRPKWLNMQHTQCHCKLRKICGPTINSQSFQELVVSELSSSKVLLRSSLPIGEKGKLEGSRAGWVPSPGDKNLRTPRMMWLELMCAQLPAITQLQTTMFLPGLPWWHRL